MPAEIRIELAEVGGIFCRCQTKIDSHSFRWSDMRPGIVCEHFSGLAKSASTAAPVGLRGALGGADPFIALEES
jgi:hypothetical protein